MSKKKVTANAMNKTSRRSFDIVGVSYVDIMVSDYKEALTFYKKVLGTPEFKEGPHTHGWRLGRTWMTLFPAEEGQPKNVGFSIEMKTPEDAERFQAAFIEAGARGSEPTDTWMYEDMRFCPVEDPFGTRILIYAPLNNSSTNAAPE